MAGATLSLTSADADRVRFGGEALYANALRSAMPKLTRRASTDGGKIRRALMARSLLLSEGMAPAAYIAARHCASRLGVTQSIEIYQAAGAENAAMHFCDQPVLLEVQGRLLSLLDEQTLQVVMGHELGHYLAHGPTHPYVDAAHLADRLLASEVEQDELLNLARRLSMSMELTADRFGLLACGDLKAALRLEMVVVTGLAATELAWDTGAYLEQSQTLVESLLAGGETSMGYTHPEHSLRAYALWLFSESDLFAELTGQGPGTRRIAEVDELLMRVLGDSKVTLGSATVFEEPQIELQECALAACVLVACADGELHEAEVEAIERAFASLVPDWRSFLDAEEALIRFQELAPLMYAGGPRVQRALFALLTHVLAADGECRREEIEQILAIGSALGCPELFRSLLPSVVAASDLSLTVVEENPVRSIPMAAEAHQVETALKVFFTRVRQRGGDSVTARRLLRLSGVAKNSASARLELHGAAERAGVSIDPVLSDELDMLHRLAPIGPLREVAPSAGTSLRGSPDELSERLRKAVARLRDKLISGDGRSPSIRMRNVRVGRAFDLFQLEDVATGLAERALELAANGAAVDLIGGADADAHDGARRVLSALIALDREHQGRREETGADELYLGYPFLTGLVGGYLVRGPLILHPVSLKRESGRMTLAPTPEEVPVVNQALLRLLMRQKQKVLTEAVAEQLEVAVTQGVAAVCGTLDQLGIKLVADLGQLRALRDRNAEFESWRDDRLEIEDCAVLGLFPQSGSDLLQDYDELLAQLQQGRSPAELMACAGELLPAELKTLVKNGDAPVETSVNEVETPLPVIFADPVQRQVLSTAQGAAALVVDGPPGTGKSQVIVNLIAEALRRGEKVAVVCEKRAALDVVVSRLDSLGFRHLLALVHDVLEDRRPLYRQLAARIEEEQPRKTPKQTPAELLDALSNGVRTLESLSALLATPLSGTTLGQAYTLHSGLDVPPLEAQPMLASIEISRMGAFADCMQALAPFAAFWRRESCWIGPNAAPPRADFSALNNDEARQFFSDLKAVLQARLVLEEACSAVSVAPTLDAIDTIAVSRAGLDAVVASRAARSAPGDRIAFCELFEALTRDPARSKLLVSAGQTIRQMEQAYAIAGLDASSNTQMLLTRAHGTLIGVAEQLRSVSAETRNLISLWLTPAPAESLRQSLVEARSRWTLAAADLQIDPNRVTWHDDLAFDAACAIVQQQDGRWLRVFLPTWWKARGTIRRHLRQHWAEQAGAAVNAPLIRAVEQRRRAASAWAAFDATISTAQLPLTAVSANEAGALLKHLEESRDRGELLQHSEPALRMIAAWPPPSHAAAWPSWAERIDAAIAAVPATAEAKRQLDALRGVLPGVDLQLTSASIGELIRVARALVPVLNARRALTSVSAFPTGEIEASLVACDRRVDNLLAVLGAHSKLEHAKVRPQSRLPWLGALTSEQIGVLVQSFVGDISRIAESDRLLRRAAEIHAGARELLLALAAAPNVRPEQWHDVVLKAWVAAVVQAGETLLSSELPPGLLEDQVELAAQDFRHQTSRSASVVADAILAQQDANSWLREPPAAKGARRTPIQSVKEGMLREARKRSAMPLRSFVRRFVDAGLLEALPVWLLSPETMATLFPRQKVFDMIIVDEASQCTVESGLPVLMRGRRVVIAGDERQMPPSNFFRAGVETEEAEEANPTRDVLDDESLLVLARSRTKHRGLAWHYRCQHEELIAFSNHALYGGALRTIPATTSRTARAAIYWHEVENATYEDGVNAVEASAVIDLLAELMRAHPTPTIGIVTFNMVQRRAVLDAIDKRRAEQPEFAALFDRESARERIDERPFVKNIENVQGDERDVIIFSLGHAPRERIRKDGRKEWYVPARFGPVGQRGGERRLNVAVSRAKQAVHVVSSFDPAMLSVANAKNEGPRLFKGFLEFAKAMAKGDRNEGGRVLDLMRGKPTATAATHAKSALQSYVPLKVQLFMALEQAGFSCELDIGSSTFKVGLAVVDPVDASRFRLGVVCIEGETVEPALETHVHIPGVLATRGWTLMRINARDWALHRDLVLERVIGHLR